MHYKKWNWYVLPAWPFGAGFIKYFAEGQNCTADLVRQRVFVSSEEARELNEYGAFTRDVDFREYCKYCGSPLTEHWATMEPTGFKKGPRYKRRDVYVPATRGVSSAFADKAKYFETYCKRCRGL